MWHGQFIGLSEKRAAPRSRHVEHVLAVLAPVARHLPERLVEEQRRLHLARSRSASSSARIARTAVVEHRALRQPEGRARRLRMEDEQLELLAELAVVALLRLLEQLQVRLERLLVEEAVP